MRYLLSIILAAFLATPAFAESPYCEMEGPHNCIQKNEDELINVTKNTINHMQLTHTQHAFRTQNDEVLEAAARHHAQATNITPPQELNTWR